LVESGSARRYLLYAIGEIALVVIGILIALQINNWNERKKELAKSHEVLKEIKENIEYNNGRFEVDIKNEEAVTNSIDIVLDNLRNQRGYHDSLDFHFLHTAYFPSPAIKSSGYETLKSQGVEMIKNSELRKSIMDLYEDIYALIEDISHISYDNSANTIWPVFTPLFYTQESAPNQPFKTLKVTPFDYNAVVESKQFEGLISWWRHSRIVSIETRMNAIDEGKTVLEMITQELN
jgi:hypothetical protein